MTSLSRLWSFRGYVAEHIKRDVRARYRNSVLGIAWAFIQPAAMILVYVTVFSHFMQSRLPGMQGVFAYAIHLCIGILAWNLFSEIVTRSASAFLENATVIKKASFPKACLPAAVTGVGVINFALGLLIFLTFLVAAQAWPGLPLLLSVVPLVLLVLIATGLGTALGILNVFFRDVGQLLGLALQVLFWLTPIVYPSSILSDAARDLLALNPLVPLVEALQAIFVLGRFPIWTQLIYPSAIALLSLAAAALLYRRHGKHMVDEL